MVVKELIAALGFEVNDAGLRKFNSGINSAKSSLKSLAVVSTAIAGTLFAITKTTADAGEEAQKMANRLGMSTDAFQALQHAAYMADVSHEEFTLSMGILTRQIGQARLGSKQAQEAFSKLGGETQRLVQNGASTDEVFLSAAQSLAAIEDPTKRAALAQELFGKSSAKMLPFLTKSTEELNKYIEQAKEYGLILDQETIEASDQFNESLKEGISISRGLKNIIGGALVKSFNPLLRDLIEWYKANRVIIQQNLTSFVSGLVDVLSVAARIFKGILNIVVFLAKPFGNLGGLLKTIVAGFMIFKAAQFGGAIRDMISGAQAAIGIFKGFGNAGLLAGLKAAAIPLLWAAGIALVILLIEDLIGYFSGKDSLFGDFVNILKEKMPIAIQFIKDSLVSVFESVLHILFVGMNNLGVRIMQMLDPIMGVISKIMGGFGSVISFFTGSNPVTAPPQGVASSKTLTNNVNAPMTFNMGNADQGTADSIATKVTGGLDELLRSTSRSFATPVGY